MGKSTVKYMDDIIIPLDNPEQFIQLKEQHKEYSYNRIRASFTCSNCGLPSVKTFKCVTVPFICSSCNRKLTHTGDAYKARYKQSMIEKYGVDSSLKSPICKAKYKETMLTRYGVENAFQYDAFKAKGRETNKRKLGVEYPGQSDACRAKGTQTYLERTGYTHNMLNPESKERVHTATVEHYGAIGFASPIIKEKQVDTVRNKYGVDSFSQTEEFIEKFHKTSLEHYGCTHPAKSKEVRGKIIQTTLERYGYENCMQNLSIRRKSLANKHHAKYTHNGIMFDSTWEISYYIWLTDNHIEFEYHPSINITYTYNGKPRIYQPDFIVNEELQEIKGNMFFSNKAASGTMVCPFDHSKDTQAEAKHRCMIENNVKILLYEDIKQYIDYVKKTYGKHYLTQCRRVPNNK